MGLVRIPGITFRETWRATIAYALVAIILSPLLLVGTFALSAMVASTVPGRPFNVVAGVAVFVGISTLWYVLTRLSVRETCASNVVSPLGVALSYAIGSVLLAPILSAFETKWIVAILVLAHGVPMGIAAYGGALAGARDVMLGPKSEGVGRVCAGCFYDLSATAEGAVCPECGGTMRYRGPVEADAAGGTPAPHEEGRAPKV